MQPAKFAAVLHTPTYALRVSSLSSTFSHLSLTDHPFACLCFLCSTCFFLLSGAGEWYRVNSSGALAILTEVLHGFPQSL
jgi:hypothetical protein